MPVEKSVELISVIIPIYKGKQYIDGLLDMIENNCKYMWNNQIQYEFEVLFVNDYPDERLPQIERKIEHTTIRMMDTDINRGIHGARCYGLEKSKGDYILFFDQDDILRENYFCSQIAKLDGYDAVVCNGVNHKRRMIYSSRAALERVNDKNVYLNQDNPIVSPGQVVIRKQAIPKEWTTYIMKNNGADDFFLWLLMLFHKCKINTNFENLYIHTIHGDNTSRNRELMDASRKEMYGYIKKCKKIDFWSRRKLQKTIMR